jgi:sec-independent protein translocase protein TatB
MFDIGWSEMAVILLVALIVIGPKDLPRLARTMGQWAAKGRAMAREFQRSLEDMAREAELDDVKREIEKVGRMDIKKSIEKTIDPTGELGRAFDPPRSAIGKPSANASAAAPNGGAPNGEAKELTVTKPEVTSEPPGNTAKAAAGPEPVAAAKPTESVAAAKPKAAEPTVNAKPKAAAPKTAAKPRTSRKSKTTSGTGPKPAASETGETETVARPR